MSERDSELIAVELRGRGALSVSGSERKSWLGRLLTNDVAALEPGVAQLGLLLNQQGKILTDLHVLEGDARILLGTAPDRGAQIEEFLSGYLIMEDVELANESDNLSWYALLGSDAWRVAREVGGKTGALAARFDGYGEGALLAAPAAAREAWIGAVTSAGARILDDEAWNAWRVARGIPLFGVDYDAGDRPHEAALDRAAVSWTKGCYLGQEVVCMQDMRGKVKRRLALLRVPGDTAVAVRAAVEHAGQSVGEVTSVARSREESYVIARLRAPYFSEPEPLSIGGHVAELTASRLSPEPAR